MLVVALQEQIIDVGILVYLFPLYVLAMIIPSLSVSIRRLHDTGHSGWWYFIIIIPLIGPVWLFVLLVTDSKPEENKWGPNPKSN